MRIRITDDKREAIIAVFKEANGKATTNALHGDWAFTIAERAEQRLTELRIWKDNRKGSAVDFTPSGPPKSYGYPMRTTSFSIERGKDNWFLVSVKAVSIKPGYSGGMTLSITPESADRITAAALKPTAGRAEQIEKEAAREIAAIEADKRKALKALEREEASSVRNALMGLHIQRAA